MLRKCIIINSDNLTFNVCVGHIKEELSKTAKDAADTISESGSKISKTSAFQTIAQTAQAVKREMDRSPLLLAK